MRLKLQAIDHCRRLLLGKIKHFVYLFNYVIFQYNLMRHAVEEYPHLSSTVDVIQIIYYSISPTLIYMRDTELNEGEL